MRIKWLFPALLSCSLSMLVYSQKLCLQLTPGYYSSFGTYRVEQTSPNSTINLTNKKWPHINWSQASFAWDLNLIKWNHHYFGVCYNIGTATTRLNYHYVANYATDTSANTMEVKTNQYESTFIQQFGLFYRFDLNQFLNKESCLHHTFSVYSLFCKDFSGYQPFYDTYHKMTDGYLIDDYENYPEYYNGKRKNLSIAIRYDLGFYTRRKHKNILNLFVAYQQGFRLMNKITLEVFHENGAYLSANSTSYGSFFSVGIAKPINLYPNRWWPKH